MTRISDPPRHSSWQHRRLKRFAKRRRLLDCRVYARAAAVIYGLDRFGERHWQRMEEALARTTERDDHEPASPRTPAVRQPARHVIHSGYMAP